METMKKLVVFALMGILLISMNSCKKNDDEEPLIIKDGDGNQYTYVTIGTKKWLVENLRTTHYNDGTPIPLVTDNNQWGSLISPAYCWYNNDSARYFESYGALYNWYAVDTDKLCPKGWHVSTDSDWTELTTTLGGDSIAGGKLKEAGTEHWNDPNIGGTNEYGFTALPGGYRNFDGQFFGISGNGNWRSTDEYDATNAWYWYIIYNHTDCYKYYGSKKGGFSVRCVKD